MPLQMLCRAAGLFVPPASISSSAPLEHQPLGLVLHGNQVHSQMGLLFQQMGESCPRCWPSGSLQRRALPLCDIPLCVQRGAGDLGWERASERARFHQRS